MAGAMARAERKRMLETLYAEMQRLANTRRVSVTDPTTVQHSANPSTISDVPDPVVIDNSIINHNKDHISNVVHTRREQRHERSDVNRSRRSGSNTSSNSVLIIDAFKPSEKRRERYTSDKLNRHSENRSRTDSRSYGRSPIRTKSGGSPVRSPERRRRRPSSRERGYRTISHGDCNIDRFRSSSHHSRRRSPSIPKDRSHGSRDNSNRISQKSMSRSRSRSIEHRSARKSDGARRQRSRSPDRKELSNPKQKHFNSDASSLLMVPAPVVIPSVSAAAPTASTATTAEPKKTTTLEGKPRAKPKLRPDDMTEEERKKYLQDIDEIILSKQRKISSPRPRLPKKKTRKAKHEEKMAAQLALKQEKSGIPSSYSTGVPPIEKKKIEEEKRMRREDSKIEEEKRMRREDSKDIELSMLAKVKTDVRHQRIAMFISEICELLGAQLLLSVQDEREVPRQFVLWFSAIPGRFLGGVSYERTKIGLTEECCYERLLERLVYLGVIPKKHKNALYLYKTFSMFLAGTIKPLLDTMKGPKCADIYRSVNRSPSYDDNLVKQFDLVMQLETKKFWESNDSTATFSVDRFTSEKIRSPLHQFKGAVACQECPEGGPADLPPTRNNDRGRERKRNRRGNRPTSPYEAHMNHGRPSSLMSLNPMNIQGPPMEQGAMGPGYMEHGPMGPGPMGQVPMGPGPMGQGPMGPGPMGQGPMGPGPMGLGPMGPGPMGHGSMGPGPMGQGPMGPGPMGQGPMGPGPMGQGPMGPGPMGQGSFGPGYMNPGPGGSGHGPMGPEPQGSGYMSLGPMGPGPGGPGPMGPGYVDPGSMGPGYMTLGPGGPGPQGQGPGPMGPGPGYMAEGPMGVGPSGPLHNGPPTSIIPTHQYSVQFPNYGPGGAPNLGPPPHQSGEFGPNGQPPMYMDARDGPPPMMMNGPPPVMMNGPPPTMSTTYGAPPNAFPPMQQQHMNPNQPGTTAWMDQSMNQMNQQSSMPPYVQSTYGNEHDSRTLNRSRKRSRSSSSSSASSYTSSSSDGYDRNRSRHRIPADPMPSGSRYRKEDDLDEFDEVFQ